MKKNSILVVFLVYVISQNIIFSQHKSYVKFSAGYNLSSNPQMLMRNVDSSSTSFTHEPVKKSFGEGVTVQFTKGVLYNENFGFELDLGLTVSNKFKSVQNYDGDIHETDMSGMKFYAIPNFVISANNSKIKPYFKIGPVVSINKIFIKEDFEFDFDDYHIEKKLFGSLSFGLNNSFGIILSKNDYNQFYIEINAHQLSFSPKKGEITSFEVNDFEHVDDLYVRYKETEFQNVYDEKKDEVNNSSKPSLTLRPIYPFSHIGIQMGLKFNLIN